MSSRSFKVVIAGAIAAFLLIVLCVSCSQPADVAYQQQPVYAQPQVVGQAPVIVQQPIVQSNHDGFFMGMLAGHMLSGGGYGGSHTTTIIHAAPVAPAPPVYRPKAPAYTPRTSFTTNSRGVSTRISRSGGISVRSSSRSR